MECSRILSISSLLISSYIISSLHKRIVLSMFLILLTRQSIYYYQYLIGLAIEINLSPHLFSSVHYSKKTPLYVL